MRKLLGVSTGVLLIVAVIAAGFEIAPRATAGSVPDSAAARPTPDTALRSTGLVPASAPGAVAADGAGTDDVAAPPATAPSTSGGRRGRTFATATPDRFNVDRPQPRVQERLSQQLAAAGPGDRLVVLVHAADAGFARRAAEERGLVVLTTFDKVGVAAAIGPVDAIRSLTTVRGISYLEADRELEYFQNTSHVATRGEEAREGFSVTYEEPQPDKAGEKKRVCKTSRNRRGRRIRTCRTVVTRSTPQPPITRTLTSPGVDGSGVTIAVIDSGVDGTHPMFQQGGKTKVVRNLKFAGIAQCLFIGEICTGKERNADDSMFIPVPDGDTISLGGHGTHVAGIAAGVDVTTADKKRAHGAAPGAKIVSLSVGAVIAVIGADAALNWVLEHHRDPCLDGSCPPIKVTNNSYGPDGGGEFDPEDTTSKLQRALALEGVVTVWANGNDGGDGSDNRSNPAGQDPTPGILSVANYDDGEAANRDNLLAPSSSRGEKGRPLTYPDISAPGTEILSACRPQLAICRGTTTSDPNYGVISGTSMAAPHIAGVVAQLFQANPNLTPAEVEDALEDTARPYAFGGSYEPDVTNDGITSFDKGHGLVDVVGAVARARLFHVFPAGSTPCSAGGPVTVDGAGDARDLAFAEGTPAPNEPALDIVSGAVGWNAETGVAQFRIRVADLPDRPLTRGSDGESFNFWFTHFGAEHRLNATRSGSGAQSFSLTGAPASAPKPTGSFDGASDTITIDLPVAALGSKTVPTPTDGTALLNLYVWSRRVAGAAAPVADRSGGLCPYTLGLGAVPPPGGTTTGPDPAPKPAPPEPEGTVSTGSPYGWDGDTGTDVIIPFTGTNLSGCNGRPGNDSCDVRYVRVDVGGGEQTLEVAVQAIDVADPIVYVYDPEGKLVAGGSSTVKAKVSMSGPYTFVVRAFASADGRYTGQAKFLQP